MSKQDEVAKDILRNVLEGLLEDRGDWIAQDDDATEYEVEFTDEYPEIVARHLVSGRELARYRLTVQVLPAGPSPNLDVVSLTAITNPDNRNGMIVAIYTRGDHVVNEQDVRDLYALYCSDRGLECDELPAALGWTDTCPPQTVETPTSKGTGLTCTIVGYLG